ncbi:MULTISPECIES: NAD-dependent epimerase/dehydratase family protein [Halococcus]|uniref:NAD-dependent epimerase/dehydratase family protein n=1 Tax=Halococcus TaxID=2249 RepID=UPI0009B5BC79|nr:MULTISPECIES: NAD-dependent epimerase/dehydratase family protein [Halococcus]
MKIPLSGLTVLVTGGGGFIGSHLVDALVAENEVRVLDDFSSGRRSQLPANLSVIEGDVRDSDVRKAAFDDVDIVFHEAAIVSVEQSVEMPMESHAINVDATLSVLEEARRTNARVVFASSAAIYGTPETLPIPETVAKRPSSPYGLEKLSADHYCQLYHDLYGLETVALRYFNVYGPRQRKGPYSGVITKFFAQARSGGPITVQGTGEQTRDFVHVRDVVRANLLAAMTDRVGEAFNIGTGRSTTIAQLAEHVRETVDPDIKIEHTDPRPGDVRDSLADVSKANEALDYEPAVELSEGIESVFDWIRH